MNIFVYRRKAVQMWIRRLRPSVCELVGQKETLARAHVGQALQLPRARLRQVIHASVVSPQAYEGPRSRWRGLTAVRQRRRRWRHLLGGKRQRDGRRREPRCAAPTASTHPPASPTPPPVHNGQTREPQRQIPQPAWPKTVRETLRSTAGAASSQSTTAFNEYRR